MTVQVGDIYHRIPYKDHWMITDVKDYGNNVYQLRVLNLETGRLEHYTSPFGLSLPPSTFTFVA